MIDMISKNEGGNVCFIITVENPLSHEVQIINGVKKAIDYNRRNGFVAQKRNVEIQPQGAMTEEDQERFKRAVEIIKQYERMRSEVSGLEQQILVDLKNNKDPYTILLYAASAISRLQGKGDDFFDAVQNQINDLREKGKESEYEKT